jgi:hypothetical protein
MGRNVIPFKNVLNKSREFKIGRYVKASPFNSKSTFGQCYDFLKSSPKKMDKQFGI